MNDFNYQWYFKKWSKFWWHQIVDEEYKYVTHYFGVGPLQCSYRKGF